MRVLLVIGVALLSALQLNAQSNELKYRSAENPYYWKNRPPFPGYWQQDVHYTLKVALDDTKDVVSGTEELTYYNNSPDELTFVYFHLYQNAFQPGSYTHDLHAINNYNIKYGPNEKNKLGTVVSNMTVDGQTVKTELDNTILKVWLPKPLQPNQSVKFKMDFSTYFDGSGTIRRRMKMYQAYGYKHYDGVHWYPRISVYDRKMGWDTDQHLTREFYGDYGVFDVEITMPNHYIMDATGIMINEQEMLPPDLRQKLDIANFAKKQWESQPSVIVEPNGTTKTWKFHSENTHDFAWTADPTYRIGEVVWKGIRCIALVQEPHCAGWLDAAAFTAKVIQVYSEDFGMYAYPKMIVADARDGMEYPMLTLDGGYAPDYYDLIAHEVGHNWFYGMVGNNETYRALLDEGFTQFLTAYACEKILGKNRVRMPYRSKYVERFSDPELYIDGEVYNGYMNEGVNDPVTVIDQHSDHFNSALRHGGGYSQVYSKTATMLFNLQYVLGDSLFQAAMKNYFEQWKFCHPYVEDFRNSLIQFTHVDLNWFFDQWLTTSNTIDYKISRVRKGDSTDVFNIKFQRNGRMQMPLDFTVYANDGKQYNYYIPNTWFEKQTTATVLPRWIGWDKLRPTYTAKVVIPSGIQDVRIDTSNRLADINMLNNSKKNPVNFHFDHRIYNRPSWKEYDLYARPDFWYNNYDGLKAGFYLGGDFMNVRHTFDLTFHYNLGALRPELPSNAELNGYDQFSVQFNYRTPLHRFVRNSAIVLTGRHIDGLNMGLVGLEFKDRSEKNRYYIHFKLLHRQDSTDLTYLINPEEWEPGKFNNSITVGYEHPYQYKRGNGLIQLQVRSSAIGSDYDYHYASLNVVNKNDLGRININTRTYAQIGTGSNWAKESMLYAAGANPEQLMDSKYTRSVGVIPDEWGGYGNDINHFHAGGGLNLRGYSGYLMPHYDWYGDVRRTYRGTSGVAVNTEIEFQELFRFIGRSMPRVNSVIGIATYVFGDIGAINFSVPGESLAFAELRADAGIGCALTIKRFPPLQMVQPLTLRFDAPLFLNRTPFASPDYIAMRWVVGISRAF